MPCSFWYHGSNRLQVHQACLRKNIWRERLVFTQVLQKGANCSLNNIFLHEAKTLSMSRIKIAGMSKCWVEDRWLQYTTHIWCVSRLRTYECLKMITSWSDENNVIKSLKFGNLKLWKLVSSKLVGCSRQSTWQILNEPRYNQAANLFYLIADGRALSEILQCLFSALTQSVQKI